MIAIVDYGCGNLFSVEKAFTYLGAEVEVTADKSVIERADKVVLPGVGAFGDCMQKLTQTGLVPTLRQSIVEKPFLGICLGLQLLFEGSEESPTVKGLGIFKGMVKKIEAPGLKIPQMGWNDIHIENEVRLLQGLPAKPYVYFVHSYHAVPEDSSLITAWAQYGTQITAAIGRNNIAATQFHPEKSGTVGLQIIKNFINLY